jgi:gas vesicle protein
MADNNKFVYFLAGLGIGTLIGILFAPRTGDETRELLTAKATEGRDFLKRKSREVRSQAEDYIARGKDVVSRQRENLEAAIDAGKQAYREAGGGAGVSGGPAPAERKPKTEG